MVCGFATEAVLGLEVNAGSNYTILKLFINDGMTVEVMSLLLY